MNAIIMIIVCLRQESTAFQTVDFASPVSDVSPTWRVYASDKVSAHMMDMPVSHAMIHETLSALRSLIQATQASSYSRKVYIPLLAAC